MVQKLIGSIKKKEAPRGKVLGKGKVSKQRKGRLAFDNGKESKASKDQSKEISRLINERNEAEFARKASQGGGGLSLIRPPPDAGASKQQTLKKSK